MELKDYIGKKVKSNYRSDFNDEVGTIILVTSNQPNLLIEFDTYKNGHRGYAYIDDILQGSHTNHNDNRYYFVTEESLTLIDDEIVGRYIKITKTGYFKDIPIGTYLKVLKDWEGKNTCYEVEGYGLLGLNIREKCEYCELMPIGFTPNNVKEPIFEIGKWYQFDWDINKKVIGRIQTVNNGIITTDNGYWFQNNSIRKTDGYYINKLTNIKEITLEEVDKYIPEFAIKLNETSNELTSLPEKWCIKINQNNFNVLKEYWKKLPGVDKTYEFKYFLLSEKGKDNSYINWNDDYNYTFGTEITFDQFKKWVLKSNEPIKSKSLVGRYLKVLKSPFSGWNSDSPLVGSYLKIIKDSYSTVTVENLFSDIYKDRWETKGEIELMPEGFNLSIKTEINIPKEEFDKQNNQSKFKVGKWYKIHNNWYAKFECIHNSGKRWKFSEAITSKYVHRKESDSFDYLGLSIVEVPDSEVEQYLPKKDNIKYIVLPEESFELKNNLILATINPYENLISNPINIIKPKKTISITVNIDEKIKTIKQNQLLKL